MTKAEKRQQELRGILIANGVRNLRTYGYPNVNDGNILTDQVYKAFFNRQLEEWTNSTLLRRDVRSAAASLLSDIGGTGGQNGRG